MDIMKTTKTVTSHAQYNYGAVLQAYSLQQYLLNSGIENEIIDMRYASSIGNSPIFSKEFTAKTIVKNAVKLVNLFSIISYRKKMKTFVTDNLKLTQYYNSFDSLLNDPPPADYYICGSDQIWNVQNKIRREAFLEFVKNSAGAKIAYAPSIAIKHIDDYCECYFKKQLSDFAAISVREKSGLDILNRMGIDACTCIDPVFLNSIEFWTEHCREYNKCTPKGKYILVYSLINSPTLFKTVDKLREKHKLPVYVITTNGITKVKKCKKIVNAGPWEFLNLIMNAEYVVSSSFHGLAFSIILRKKFLAYANDFSGSRTSDMLTVVGLEKNLITNHVDISVADSIDYTMAEKKLIQAIEFSKKFLTEALDE